MQINEPSVRESPNEIIHSLIGTSVQRSNTFRLGLLVLFLLHSFHVSSIDYHSSWATGIEAISRRRSTVSMAVRIIVLLMAHGPSFGHNHKCLPGFHYGHINNVVVNDIGLVERFVEGLCSKRR
jgi:hypothetical protein